MKISDFLKNQGVFSNEIKARFQNGQIRVNGEVIKNDIVLNFNDPTPPPKFSSPVVDIPYEAGDWIFQNLITKMTKEKKDILFTICNLFDIETIFSGGCQIGNKPIEDILPELNVIKNHIFLKASKKQFFILKLN